MDPPGEAKWDLWAFMEVAHRVLDDSHDIASTFIALEGVIGINLVYANFEDDPTVQKAAVR